MMKENPNSNSSLKIVMRKLNSLFLLFLIITFIPSTILGGPIEDLKPGEWYEVPNSRMIDVAPTEGFGNGSPQYVIIAWNSGAYDTKRDRLIVWGGGHGNYGGNEVYTFDINTLSWSRVWGPSPDIPTGWGLPCFETYNDGNPVSRHTYDGIEFIPSIDKFFSVGGSLYCGSGGHSDATWTFDFNNLSWERQPDVPDSMLGDTTYYDPATGHIFHRGSKYLSEYDPVNATWTTRVSVENLWICCATGAIDPVNRLFVEVGSGFIRAIDLNTWKVFTPATTGDSSIEGVEGPGFVYDPVSKKFVAWVNGTSVYTLDVTTSPWTWTKRPPSSTNTVTPATPASDYRGTYGRFRYIPSKNAFVMYNNAEKNVFFYKLSSGGGTPPPDTTAPTVSITSPSSGVTVSNSITISANASDNVGVVGVQFKLDGVNLNVEDTASPYLISWDTTQTTDGTHILTAAARDAAGNTTSAENVIITVSNGGGQAPDTTSPTVSITTPVQGADVSDVITISANASDNVEVKGVQFKLNGSNLGTEDTTAPYSTSWDTKLVANNSYTITAVARDSSENTTTAVGVIITVSNTVTQPPTGQIDIPLKTWIARPAPEMPEGPDCINGGCKHMRLAHNPDNGLIYFLGGDYNGQIGFTSGRNEIFSYSVADDTWTLEQSYCAAAGEVQPSHPDEVGWVYDTNRKIFWMTPGHQGSDQGICSSTLVKGKIMTFDPLTRKWDLPVRDAGVTGHSSKFAQYDPVTDTIIRFVGDTEVHIYDIKTDTWEITSYAQDINGIAIQGNAKFGTSPYTAMDLKNRHIYIIGVPESRLYRYHMDSKQMEYLIDTPVPVSGTWAGDGLQHPVWDSVSEVLLWPQIFDMGGWPMRFHIYHPDTNTWEADLPNHTPDGIEVTGNNAVFDPDQNAFLLMGGSTESGTVPPVQYVYLYRYGDGSSTPPPSDTTPPSISITDPVSGTSVSETITVSANASDNVAVAGVQFKLDGTNLGAENTTPPFSISWDTTQTTDGTHILTAVARDAALNTTTSASITVTVSNATTPPPTDTTPPTVSITSPSSGVTVSNSITISANASDNVGVVDVQFKLDGANLGAEDTTSPYSTSWDTTAIADGSHTLTAVARNAAGNTAIAGDVIVIVSNSQSNGTVYNANPSNYGNFISQLQPGDTLLLEAGNYYDLLRITALNGTPGNPIIISGPETGQRAILYGQTQTVTNIIEITNSSYIEIRNLEIDCRYNSAGIASKTVTHHITLENLYIHSFSSHQQFTGISANHNVSWNWIIRNNIITDGGTGIYLGDSDGDSQFINGIIENNLIYDTIGYNMQIKHQIPRPTNIPGMPTGKSKTIIRNNVFSKDVRLSSSGDLARPNLLVGHYPLSGTGMDDEYHIYGNLFLGNPSEASFQGEGNVAFYNNIIINTMINGFLEIAIQKHLDAPKMVRVFNNTIVSVNKGIGVSGGDLNFEQKVIGNAVFSDIPISATDQTDNIVDSFANAINHLNNPGGTIDVDLDLFPKPGILSGNLIDTSSINTFTDWNKDFNGNLHDGTFRGAYSGEGNNPGWKLKLDRKPLIFDATSPSVPQGLNASVISHSQINLSWQAANDPESGISKYIVYRNGASIGQPTSTSFSDTGLDESNTYTYEVSAVNGTGLESEKSTTILAKTLADTLPPTIVSVVSNGTPNEVKIQFSESVEQISAENTLNYIINNITISDALLGSDSKTVTLTTGTHIEGISYTLTVNNIKDKASVPNMIASDTQAMYTFQAQLIISDLTVTSGKIYEVVQNGLINGAVVYVDRTYTITSIPPSIKDSLYIKTANDDKGLIGDSFLVFNVNQDVTVYVAYDNRITSKPSWLDTFADTGDDLITSDTTLNVLKKDFASGTVILNGNEGGMSMYSVVVKPREDSKDMIPPSSPTGLTIIE